nr:uncharacterized protein LOC124809814 [Hydra vulgaris]
MVHLAKWLQMNGNPTLDELKTALKELNRMDLIRKADEFTRNLLKLDLVMGTVTVQETGIYYIFVNLAIAPDLNNYPMEKCWIKRNAGSKGMLDLLCVSVFMTSLVASLNFYNLYKNFYNKDEVFQISPNKKMSFDFNHLTNNIAIFYLYYTLIEAFELFKEKH